MSDVGLISALLAVDPNGLGGVWVRARHGAARDAVIKVLKHARVSHTDVRHGHDDVALFGGTDMAASLAAGRVIVRTGMAQMDGFLWLHQSERLETERAARLAGQLDQQADNAVILLDEGTEDDQLPPSSLRERLAFFLNDSGAEFFVPRVPVDEARRVLPSVKLGEPAMASFAVSAARLGIPGLRPVLFAAQASRALAALNGRTNVTEEDIQTAARLVFGHRTAVHPEDSMNDLPPPPPQTEETQRDDTGDDGESQSGLSEVVLGAAKTALPEDVLSEIAKRTRLAMGRGDGLARISKRRGRPLPSRPGKLDGRNRLDLLATLNAAAPWQRLRNAEPGSLSLRLSDIRVKRYRDRSERILIFAVDASGSAAMARLAEAKGAAEVLLAKAYESRDEVALAVFRKDAAELILPPTRSLTRAKRLLSAMPAGGATPLAQGIRLATDLGVAAQRAGKAAQVILMTDGRANCALDGSKDRQIAQSDAMAMASHLRTVGVPCVILDSGRRPSQQLTQLAQQLDAEIVALPRLGEALTTNVAP